MISLKVKKKLYFNMKRIRMIEERIADRYSEWEMRCPTHLSLGQEAIAAAGGLILKRDDYVVSTHRAHAHYLAKGGDLNKMIAEIYGKQTGCSKGKGGSMHLVDESVGFMGSTAIVGGTIPVGVGLGLSIKYFNENRVSCVFFGEGSTEEGVYYESLNFAALKNLPVLFICENNMYSVYSPLKVRQPVGRKISEVAKVMGINSFSGNGFDALEAYSLLSKAYSYIKENDMPCLVELTTYRYREHCGPNFDNDIGYRSVEEYEGWLSKDSIKNYEKAMLNNDEITKDDIKQMARDINEEIETAFEYAKNSPWPAKNEIFTDIYSDRL